MFHRFAKLVGIHYNPKQPSTPLASELLIKVHHYMPAQQSFLGPIGRLDELFATKHCSVIKASSVLGKCKVLDVKHQESSLGFDDPFHFFCLLVSLPSSDLLL